jgi:hypothetical protein
MAGRNRKLVPECHRALEQLKYEIASEFGVPMGAARFGVGDTEFADELGGMAAPAVYERTYMGNLTSREAGSVGGEITKRLIRQAQQTVL